MKRFFKRVPVEDKVALENVRRNRRWLSVVSALLGLFPFLHAAEMPLPLPLLRFGDILWGTFTIVLVCVLIDEARLMLRVRRRGARQPRGDRNP